VREWDCEFKNQQSMEMVEVDLEVGLGLEVDLDLEVEKKFYPLQIIIRTHVHGSLFFGQFFLSLSSLFNSLYLITRSTFFLLNCFIFNKPFL
jgi:hypothetical protein